MPIKSVVQHSFIGVTAAGDNTLVAAVTGKKIRVLGAVVIGTGGANTVRFESGASGTALTASIDLTNQDAGGMFPIHGVGWFETAAGALLNLELANATLVEVNLVYEEIE